MTPRVRELLDELRARMQGVLGDKLIGLYLTGSLVVGDFDPRLSDVDLVAALASDVDEREFAALLAMHDILAREYPEWAGRIEVRYLSLATMNSPDDEGEIVSISPGEPLNRRRSDGRWQIDWYLLREKGVALHGPSPKEIVAPIPPEAFVRSVKANVQSWGEWIDDMRQRKGQAYAILAMCRALYACQHRDQLSKKQAVLWAQRELPEWADLIGNALAWREASADEEVDHAATYPETVRFVEFARRCMLG